MLFSFINVIKVSIYCKEVIGNVNSADGGKLQKTFRRNNCDEQALDAL